MHIDKYKQPDGWFKWPDENGCDYESPVDLLGSMVHFCGCGCPEVGLRYLAQVMRLIENIKTTGWSKDSWAALDSFFKSEGEQYFVYYMLNHFGFTEHGGSVPGWLTDEGREFLEDVEALPAETD